MSCAARPCSRKQARGGTTLQMVTREAELGGSTIQKVNFIGMKDTLVPFLQCKPRISVYTVIDPIFAVFGRFYHENRTRYSMPKVRRWDCDSVTAVSSHDDCCVITGEL